MIEPVAGRGAAPPSTSGARFAGKFFGVHLASNTFIELPWYMFSVVFLLGPAWTLRHDGPRPRRANAERLGERDVRRIVGFQGMLGGTAGSLGCPATGWPFGEGDFMMSIRHGRGEGPSPAAALQNRRRGSVRAVLDHALVTRASAPFVAALLLIAATPSIAEPVEEPLPLDYSETTRVELVQLEVTAWPRDGETASCQDLRTEDFEVVVNGRLREIVAADRLGAVEIEEADAGQPLPDRERPPLTLVLFFDLWHLDLFYRDYTCPITKPLAFDEARKLVRSEFREGDRLLLVTFSGWPQIHEGWIRDPAQALRALDRLEVSPTVMRASRIHQHHDGWIEGMKSLMLALGRYPGRKEVIYLADDFRFDEELLKFYDVAARAQANQVFIHAIDLLAPCRALPGPACPGLSVGGLGCSEDEQPVALGYVSIGAGGTLFHHDDLPAAVRELRRMLGCRYLISFKMPEGGKRAPQAKVRLLRSGFQLHYPSSFGNPLREPSEREQQDALFLLPRFGEGLEGEIGLWPLRPTGKKRKHWRGVMIARLRRPAQETWAPGLERIEIEAVVHKGSKIVGRFGKVIEGSELARFRAEGEAPLMVFPLDKFGPGTNTVVLRAVGVGSEISAIVRSSLEVPDPPGPGQAHPWFLSEGLARAGDALTLLPSLDGVLGPAHSAAVVGYGCVDRQAQLLPARLVSLDGEPTETVALDWLDPEARATGSEAGCGWLVGRVDPSLPAGLWRFEPPPALTAQDSTVPPIEFRVAAP